jgi:hypothetical protein
MKALLAATSRRDRFRSLATPQQCHRFGDDPALRRRLRQLELCRSVDRQGNPGRAIALAAT